MQLTPRELNELAEIEKQLASQDPKLERRMAGRRGPSFERIGQFVSSPIRFRILLALLLTGGPAALTVSSGTAGIAAGFVAYLLVFALVVLRTQTRPFTFPRLRRFMEYARDKK